MISVESEAQTRLLQHQAAAHGFSMDDLAANRAGRVTRDQARRMRRILRRRDRPLWGYALLCVLVAVLVPTPSQTFSDVFNDLKQSPTADGTLWSDVFWTGQVAVLGFLLGSAIGIGLALLFLSSRILAQALMPYVVASQTVPIIALVPPLIVTIGLGIRSEILVSAYLAFFSITITISTYKGLQSVEPLAFDLMRSYAASRRQIFTKLRLPASLPFMFTGLKIGVTASLIGATLDRPASLCSLCGADGRPRHEESTAHTAVLGRRRNGHTRRSSPSARRIRPSATGTSGEPEPISRPIAAPPASMVLTIVLTMLAPIPRLERRPAVW